MSDSKNLIEGRDWTAEELVPHSGHMVLIDKVTACTHSSINAELTIKKDELFMVDGKVPSWVSIEYMAQAIGAYAGVQAKLVGEPVVVGLLIGTRRLECEIPYFEEGEFLQIAADKIHEEENGLSVFACKIESPRGVITANLNVFVPKDFDAYMSGESI